MIYEQQEDGRDDREAVGGRDAPSASRNEPVAPVKVSIPQMPWRGVRTGRDGLLRRIENVLGSIS